MLISKIRFLAALLALSATSGAAAAQDAPDGGEAAQAPGEAAEGADAPETADDLVDAAVTFAKTLTDEATAALTSEEGTEEDRLTAFQDILKDGMALDYIARRMIGEARNDMTDAQKTRYKAVFPDYITRQYAEQFADIVGQPLEFSDAKERRGFVAVRMTVNRRDGRPIPVSWVIRRDRSEALKIYDITVNSVSIMLVKSDEFAAFIQANGIDALLDRLEADAITKTAAAAPGPEVSSSE
ncbi:MAG: ABC transporter substrate-binding protein [Pseudomonadota bacterium]